ncbi:MAG TPA: TlpA disulfide reductase family protein [Terracidiphilus sp.]|jgi:thiol-disulfide isomerase/thioredoxin
MSRALCDPARLGFAVVLTILVVVQHLPAQGTQQAPKPGEPTDPKARKTYQGALDWQKQRGYSSAISDFRKANQQDGGHCSECLRRAYSLAIEIGAYKDAADISRERLAAATTPIEQATAHYQLGTALQRQGLSEKKDKCFEESCGEFKAVLNTAPKTALAHYALGVSLAHLRQDDAARQEFSTFLDQDKGNQDKVSMALHERVSRYMDNINLARAAMAPPFSLTTIDGKQISMDGLAGKVVLIDFWATWCGPCREALPHIKKIAEKFSEQPLVVLSISVDTDDAKWRDFVAKNQMTWLQYRDNGFDGKIATLFNIHAIPSTFSIDADGVLEDQHVGDADIEGKLKKMIVRAVELNKRKEIEAMQSNPVPTPQ